MLKDISCGHIRTDHVGQTLLLAGWISRRRDHGNLIFIDLRDRDGVVQVVFNPETHREPHKVAESLRSEWVVQISGLVRARPEGTENLDLPTGRIEIEANNIEVLNESKTPPFEINEDSDIDEMVRLKYRYLDLRRPKMRDILVLRHKVVKFIRDFLDKRGFLEIETPILIKSTPEGARDYIVPSRLYPGQFYALPQSPQQLKQLLMTAGVEKYFQIARCFRDEDPRSDRLAGEHTQLDMEMSFVEQEDVLNLTEELYCSMIETLLPEKRVLKPFPRLTYTEAMKNYSTDKPDIRFGLKTTDLTDIAKRTEFQIFQSVIAKGGIVKGFSAPGCAQYSRKQLDGLIDFVKSRGASGLVSVAIQQGPASIDDISQEHVKSAMARFASLDDIKKMATKTGSSPGDLMLIIAGPQKPTNIALSALRNEMGSRLGLTDPDLLAFAFVLDFPLFEWDADEQRWDAMHHAFSMPKPEHIQYVETDPGKVHGYLYDLVCNGFEQASGSIRIHKRDLQEKVFGVLGYTEQEMQERFGQLLGSFEYGAPPHGGIAPGIDRLLMVLTGIDNVRDVVAFPKAQSAIDPLFEAPSTVDPDLLKELHIQIVKTP